MFGVAVPFVWCDSLVFVIAVEAPYIRCNCLACYYHHFLSCAAVLVIFFCTILVFFCFPFVLFSFFLVLFWWLVRLAVDSALVRYG